MKLSYDWKQAFKKKTNLLLFLFFKLFSFLSSLKWSKMIMLKLQATHFNQAKSIGTQYCLHLRHQIKVKWSKVCRKNKKFNIFNIVVTLKVALQTKFNLNRLSGSSIQWIHKIYAHVPGHTHRDSYYYINTTVYQQNTVNNLVRAQSCCNT